MGTGPRRRRQKPTAQDIRKRLNKYGIPKGETIEYKNIPLLQRFLSERGKILSRRITGVSAKQQRAIARAIKRARFLALLSVGGGRRK